MIDAAPGLKVSVLVDGERTTEYRDPDPAPCTGEGMEHWEATPNWCNNYIEARNGAGFEIHCTATNLIPRPTPQHECQVNIYIDGKFMDSTISGNFQASPAIIRVSGVNIGRGEYGERKHFLFTPVETGR